MKFWRLLAALIGRLPWRALPTCGALVGWIAGSLLRIRRAHVNAAMRRANLRIASTASSVAWVSRGAYAALGTSALEFLWMASGRDGALDAVRFEPASQLRWRAALATGRGVVIAGSHTGNWDLAACALAREVDLLVVTKRLKSAALDRFWQENRASRGVTLVEARGAASRATQALRRGGAVAMMIDQAPRDRRHSLAAEFLGGPAWVDRAPAVLAARTGAPLVTAVSLRDGAGQHWLHVLSVMPPPARPGRAWIDAATRSATGALETFVRANPTQWMWLHRRWKVPPEIGSFDPGEAAAMLPDPCKTRSSSPVTPSKAA